MESTSVLFPHFQIFFKLKLISLVIRETWYFTLSENLFLLGCLHLAIPGSLQVDAAINRQALSNQSIFNTDSLLIPRNEASMLLQLEVNVKYVKHCFVYCGFHIFMYFFVWEVCALYMKKLNKVSQRKAKVGFNQMKPIQNTFLIDTQPDLLNYNNTSV